MSIKTLIPNSNCVTCNKFNTQQYKIFKCLLLKHKIYSWKGYFFIHILIAHASYYTLICIAYTASYKIYTWINQNIYLLHTSYNKFILFIYLLNLIHLHPSTLLFLVLCPMLPSFITANCSFYNCLPKDYTTA